MKKAIWKGLACVLVAAIFLIPTGLPALSRYSCSKIETNLFLTQRDGDIQTRIAVLNGDSLDQYSTEDDDAPFCVTWKQWLAQSFKPSMPTLTRIELKIGRCNNLMGEMVKISLKNNLDEDEDIVNVTWGDDDLPASWDWVEWDFEDIAVIPEQEYFIVAQGYEGTACVCWASSDTNPYGRGKLWIIDVDQSPWTSIDVCDLCFRTYGISIPNNPPEKPSKPSGPTSGKTGETYTYTTSTTDPDENKVKYGWDWNGDKMVDVWTDLYTSGITVEASYSWNEEGTYEISVKAQDEHGLESDWSDPLPVSMPKIYENPLWTLSERIFDWLLHSIFWITIS